MILFRPVGSEELRLIAKSGFRSFPPRLPHQPIFYPVLTFEYAEQIARDWNTTQSEFAGFVTRFELDDAYAAHLNVRTAGAQDIHRELWIQAEDLAEFNSRIVGLIKIEAAYYGKDFSGEIDPSTNLPLEIAQVLRQITGVN
jgi:hypothetical protein